LKIYITILALTFTSLSLLAGCGIFGKKKFEDTDTYREMIRVQDAADKKLDSIRRENYKQVNDSVNTGFKKQLDSLKRSTDSLEKELEKSIQNLKNSKK